MEINVVSEESKLDSRTPVKFLNKVFDDSIAKKIIGAVLAVALFGLMLVFDRGSGIKHMILSLGLAIGCGILIPMKRFPLLPSIILFVLYIAFVPYRLFLRMQLPVDNMAYMQKRSMLMCLIMMCVIYVVFFVITQRVRIALAAGNILFLIITLIDYYVITFRGQAASFADFRTVGTMVTVWGNYDYTPSGEVCYSILWFLFFTLFALKLDISPKSIKEKFPEYKAKLVHIIVSVAGAIGAAAFFIIITATPFLENHGIDDSRWTEAQLSSLHGLLLYPFVEYRSSRMYAPSGYSEENVLLACKEAGESFKSEKALSGDKPNIIVIMNEAFSDPRVLGDLETEEPIMPFTDSLFYDDNALRGNLYMSILGGFTVNSEFEFLTGNSIRFLPSSVIPYLSEIHEYMPSLVSEMETIGYDTVAMHPNGATAYERKTVYDCFGFNRFVALEDMSPDVEKIGAYTTDKSNYDEIIKCYENRDKDKPLFLFDVTIQNHSPYWKADRTSRITAVGSTTEGIGDSFIQEESYLDLISESDRAFEYLIDYFREAEEPVAICMFGDHQAIHTDGFYNMIYEGKDMTDQEKLQRKYIVPYIMWSNYDAGFFDPGDFSANYLGAVLLEELGLPMSSYRKFQLELKDKYPVLSSKQLSYPSGEQVDPETEKKDQDILNYKYLQYNRMYSGKTVESVYVPEEYDVKAPEEAKDWKEFASVCHALGSLGTGEMCSNSLEAFEYNYKRGYKVFEADLQITSDNVYVLRHDWDMDLGQADSFGWTGEDHRIPTAEEFLSVPIFGKYTPMTLETWFGIMKEHPDIWFITDTKYSPTVPDDFRLFIDTAKACGCEDVLDRVIVQLYYEDMYEEVNSVYPFKNYIYTLYYVGYPEDTAGLFGFMEKNNIGGLTMPENYWDERKKADMSAPRNFNVYLHTVDDLKKAVNMLDGVDGLYTNELTESALEYIKQKGDQ